MNVRLLRKVAKHITEEPKRLAMSAWLLRKGNADYRDGKVHDLDGRKCRVHPYAKCGTAACLAGWTVLLSSPKPEDVVNYDVADEAIAILDLPEPEDFEQTAADRLFHVRNWPREIKKRYREAKTPRWKAAATVARIEHFIKTKGKE